jgi:hypothetical protein
VEVRISDQDPPEHLGPDVGNLAARLVGSSSQSTILALGHRPLITGSKHIGVGPPVAPRCNPARTGIWRQSPPLDPTHSNMPEPQTGKLD